MNINTHICTHIYIIHIPLGITIYQWYMVIRKVKKVPTTK